MITTKPKVLISKNMNRKLSPGKIAVFNLPAGLTCRQACPGCYAMKAQRIYRSARDKREWNWVESQKPDFVPRMLAELETGHCKDIKIMRWHESGDFYSQTYVDAVACVVANRPLKTFYAYTKRLSDWDFSRLRRLHNMILIDSLKFGPVNYGDTAQVATWQAAGALVCPANKQISCNHGCDLCCNIANKDLVESRGIVFHKH